MSTKGQTITDRLNAAKYTLAGQALARCICKATTEELMRPKKKHLDYLAACTHEINVPIAQMANLLIERTNHPNWVVVFKALITVHHLMSYGNERFTQYLASSNYTFQLDGFLDRYVAKGYAMSTFIRRYSNYINQKALSYRTLAVDLCRAPRSDDNVLRTMPIERLLETLPVIHKQLESLLDFDCTGSDLNNSIIVACFWLLFHDAKKLFASYNDGIINLFEKYFDLNKKMCREAFEAYKKFLTTTDRVAEFLKVAESINLERGEIPDFKRAPSSLLDAFEEHLLMLESSKRRSDTNNKQVVIDAKLGPIISQTRSVPQPPLLLNSSGSSIEPIIGGGGPPSSSDSSIHASNTTKPEFESSFDDQLFMSKPDGVADFLEATGATNIERAPQIPNFKQASSSLLDAFEDHLFNLESSKDYGNMNNKQVVIDTKLAPMISQAPLMPQQPLLMNTTGAHIGPTIGGGGGPFSSRAGAAAASNTTKKEFKNNFDAQLSSLVDKAKESLK